MKDVGMVDRGTNLSQEAWWSGGSGALLKFSRKFAILQDVILTFLAG
jgi:hypothetical protein